MKILIVGSGGREHALAWKIAKSPKAEKIFCAPGNAGIAQIAECVNIKSTDIPSLLAFAIEKKVDLAIIGPESPLILGITDEFRNAGIMTFGPSKAAAAIEGSKVFSKELMAKYNIPSADFKAFNNPQEANIYINDICGDSNECRVVIKADGEAFGKGVYVCSEKNQALEAIQNIMVDRLFGKSGDRLIIEERLEGQEASLMSITDGEIVIPLKPAQDYKRAYDNDEGLNTGGMGCYSPVPIVTDELYSQVMETIIKPTVAAMKAEGCLYTGLLYTGIMLTKDGPKVLEYNARFGDPETQVVLPLLESDLLDLMVASLDGSLDSVLAKWYNKKAVCVVVASGGYPGDYTNGFEINGLETADSIGNVTVFHAGTRLIEGAVVTNGGRVLGITATGDTYTDAVNNAYKAVDLINFEGMHYRTDIGARVKDND
ncbi:MAG: phosphoribosylamine--glycine ligase [Armatimonadota bacterium]